MVHCAASVCSYLYNHFSPLLTAGRWSYGASRVQIEADIKILNDFQSLLQQDALRGSHTISSASLSGSISSSRGKYARMRTKSIKLKATLRIKGCKSLATPPH